MSHRSRDRREDATKVINLLAERNYLPSNGRVAGVEINTAALSTNP